MKNPEGRGVYGYYDAVRDGRLKRGGDDFKHIHKFFADAQLTLVGMSPADKIAGGDSVNWKCITGNGVTIVYLANPSGTEPSTDYPSSQTPTVSLKLFEENYAVRWFNPMTGQWTEGGTREGADHSFEAPSLGD